MCNGMVAFCPFEEKANLGSLSLQSCSVCNGFYLSL